MHLRLILFNAKEYLLDHCIVYFMTVECVFFYIKMEKINDVKFVRYKVYLYISFLETHSVTLVFVSYKLMLSMYKSNVVFFLS